MSPINSVPEFGSSLFGPKSPNLPNANALSEIPGGEAFNINQANPSAEITSAKARNLMNEVERLPAGAPLQQTNGTSNLNKLGRGDAPTFGEMLENLVESVDDKRKMANEERSKVLAGESDNLHQSVIAMQEAGVAFTLLVEVRNKLTESYQELMKMQV